MGNTAVFSAGHVNPIAGKPVFGPWAVVFLWVLLVATLELALFPVPQTEALVAAAALTLFSLGMQVYRKGFEQSGPAALFALTMLVFIWARPLIALTSSDFDLRLIEAFSGIPVSIADERIYLSAVIASLLAYSATVLCNQLPTPARIANSHPDGDRPFLPSSLQVWSLLFWMGAAASLVQSALYVRYFLSGGSYFDLYLNKDTVEIGGLSLVASFLFYGYLGLLLGTDREASPELKRRRRWWTVAFVLLSLLGLSRGSRGEVFTQLLAGLWMLSFTREKRIPLKVWAISAAALFGLSQMVSAFRSGGSSGFGDNPLLKIVEWFVYSQGLSGELVAPANQIFGVSPANLRFIFSPLLAPLRRVFDPEYGAQTAQHGVSSGLLSSELAYRVAPEYYLAGHGMGSSYMAETYCALGLVGVLAATALLTWIVLRGPQLSLRSRSALFIFAGSLPYILFTPRESLTFPVVPALKAMVLLVLCRKLQKAFVLLRS